MDYFVRDISLADKGKQRIEWARRYMPTLRLIDEEFNHEKPLKGIRICACLHVTKETANLVIALKNAGAEVYLAASNPLSTQDDVAAALVKYYDIDVYAKKGESEQEYWNALRVIAEKKPEIVLDDGGDLIVLLHEEFSDIAKNIWGGSEETTTGVIREKALENSGLLKFPIIATNNATIKRIVDNRFGTGQSAIDGIIRSTNILIAGKTVVVVGYGYVGMGIAQRMRGLGAKVIVVEVDPIRALEAHYNGFEVMKMEDAALVGDIFITATGNIDVIRYEHIQKMKDGAILCNAGHFNVEINLKDLEKLAIKKEKIGDCVEKYILKTGRSVYLLGEGRLVNLACAEGHPSEVMNVSFSLQALVAKYIAANANNLEKKVYEVPRDLEMKVAELTLRAFGKKIDTMTKKQQEYMKKWK
ncbi:MAG: adenosylhomocysteinase [Candidatus Njordarchaeota archaeon]